MTENPDQEPVSDAGCWSGPQDWWERQRSARVPHPLRPPAPHHQLMVNSVFNGWRMENVWLDR